MCFPGKVLDVELRTRMFGLAGLFYDDICAPDPQPSRSHARIGAYLRVFVRIPHLNSQTWDRVMTSLSLIELHHLSVRITFLHAQTREETDGHSIMRLVRMETAYGITTPRTPSNPWIYRGVPAAQPLYVEPQDMNKQVTVSRWVIRTRILFRTASPCPLLLRRREDPPRTRLVRPPYSHPSTYVQTYQLGHIPSPVSSFYHCCACSARKMRLFMALW